MLFPFLKARQKLHPEGGFSTLEVIATSLIATGFIFGMAQAMLLAAMVNIRAQEKAEAMEAIEEDISEIQWEAANYTGGTCGNYGRNFRDYLRSNGYGDSANITFMNGNYTLNRGYPRDPTGDSLEITYSVTYNGSNSRTNIGAIVDVFTKVTPDEVLSCP